MTDRVPVGERPSEEYAEARSFLDGYDLPDWVLVDVDATLDALDALAVRVAELETAVSHPRALENAAMRLAQYAEAVNEGVMSSGLAYKRDTLRFEIGRVRALVEADREQRRAALASGVAGEAGGSDE